MKTFSKRNAAIDPLKSLGIAALLAVGLTLFAKPPPRGEDWGSIQFANLGDEPRATGVATLTGVNWTSLSHYDYEYLWMAYQGTLTVECQNLTPGARYSTPAGTFKADRRGRGKVTGDVSFVIVWEISWWGSSTMLLGDLVAPYVVEVVRLNPEGSSTPALSGSFVPPQ